MRSDTKSLLNRLGQPDFNYREYDDSPAASTERWPLFEVVSRQMRHGLGRASEEVVAETPLDQEPEITGNDIQSLIARIAQGRMA